MANFVSPEYSRKQVSKAGNRISAGNGTVDDYVILENWRASHAWVINTFQVNLRRRSRGTSIVVGTRLKRRPTILNKLQSYPNMQLGRMHDIAGCRVIFPTMKDLLDFRSRSSLHRANFAHDRRSIDEEKWNYISFPKKDGYRGIHDVYEHASRSSQGADCRGLLIEIQYRTLAQHSWATAVEVSGLLTHNNPKFGQGAPEFVEFFAVASEILARHFEGMTSCFPTEDIVLLKNRLLELENQTHIIQLFKSLNSKIVSIDFRKNNILIFPLIGGSGSQIEGKLQIHSFDYIPTAISKYNGLEIQRAEEADIVLVRADNFANLRSAFRNYFADTTEFVPNIEVSLEAI